MALNLNLRRYMARLSRASTTARGRVRRVIKDDEGATMVETAISTTMVLCLLFGVFDFSLAFYTYHYVSDAAREATRYAIVRGNTSCSQTPNLSNCDAGVDQIEAYVKGLTYPGINPSYMGVTTTWNTGTMQSSGHTTWSNCGTTNSCKAPGNQVQVTVTYDFPLSVPFWKQTGLRVSSTSAMVISQ